MFSWKLVMVKISQFWLMHSTNIHHRHARIRQIVLSRLPAEDRRLVHSHKQAARKKLVFVRTTRMGKYF